MVEFASLVRSRCRGLLLSPRRKFSCWSVRGIAVLCAGALAASRAATARAAGVVGAGTAASCTNAALNDALAEGGLVTFNCGGPATIDIGTDTKIISVDTTIDGGGEITISANADAAPGDRVGVFHVESGAPLTVKDLTIANGLAQHGGGISNDGTLTVLHSTFTDNIGAGGGIYNGSGLLTVTDSTLTGNRGIIVGSGGGGIYNDSGTVLISRSVFANNTAYGGFAGNVVGAGIFNHGGSMAVTDSTFTNNSADYAGAIYNVNGTLTVANSTFTLNSGGHGGAIANGYFGVGSLTVTNSTFVDNDGSDYMGGGGIFNGGILTVTNCTFARNRGELSAISNNGTATLRNAILTAGPFGDSCGGAAGITDGGHNLDDGTSCGFTAATSWNNTDPELDPAGLQDNGGPTQTIALLPTSPMIEAGDQSVCHKPPVDNLDQRGFVRPGAGHSHCSIGAYEADASTPETCVGDCDGDRRVTVDELVTGVTIALGIPTLSQCGAFDCSGDSHVTVDCLVKAVNSALDGCSR